MVLGIGQLSVGRVLVGIAVAACIAVLAVGCGSGEAGTGSPTLGRSCGSDTECGSGETCARTLGDTVVGECTKPCAADSDCGKASVVCGVLSDGTRGCMKECSSSNVPCVNDIPTACGAAPDRFCQLCGCPAGSACDPVIAEGCVEVRDVGEPCQLNVECKSGNCSRISHVCRVALGQNCDKTNCDLCRTNANGYSYCSRECSVSVECGTAGACVGSSGYYTCVQKCTSLSDPACPGRCGYTSDSQVLYCQCEGCAELVAPRPLGAPCGGDGNCASQLCLSRHLGIENFMSYSSGLCSAQCASAADCTAGAGCVNVPCETDAASASDRCGSVCLPACAGGGCEGGAACVSATTVAGVQGTFCDPRGADTGLCNSNSDCLSRNCVANRCASSGGQANGGACQLSSQCASMNCVAGVCRGKSQSGDACASNNDCTVGCCKNSVCNPC